MKTPEQWIEEMGWESYRGTIEQCDIAAIQSDARVDMEDATLKSAFAQQSLMHEVDALKEQNKTLVEALERWDKVKALTPIPPQAITYEQGWRILDAVQETVVALAAVKSQSSPFRPANAARTRRPLALS